MIEPIHVAAVGLGNLRFYAPPSGRREFPWAALEDAMHCFCLPRGMRRQATRDLQEQWKGQAVTIPTRDGPVLIVPHFMAQGMVNAMAECGRCEERLIAVYAVAGAMALGKITEGFGPDDLMAYCRDALADGEARDCKGRRR